MPLSTSPPSTASSSASADFYFNGFTKTFFEIHTETIQEKAVNIAIPFPKKNDNLIVFLKSAEGLQFKEALIAVLKKIKIIFNKPSFDENQLFEKLVNDQITVDQAYLDCLHFFVGILELAQDEMIAEDQRKKSIEDLFDEKSDRTSIKNNYFNLMKLLVKHAVDALKTWADKRKISYSDDALSYFMRTFSNSICERNRDLFITGIKLLRNIASLAENNKIPSAKEFIVTSLLQNIDVCDPGVYTHLQDTQLQLSIDIATEFTSYRRALAEDIANEILFKRYPYRDKCWDVHVVNAVISYNAKTLSLGLLSVADTYSGSCSRRASEMQEAFIAEFKKKLTPRNLIDIIVDKLLASLHDYIESLNKATSGEAREEIKKNMSILFDSYGEDKKTFCERSLFDNTVLEKSEYKKYVLSSDVRDMLVATLTRRLINSGYLEETEIETVEHEKGVFYCFIPFPESSFFISKSNEVNGLFDSVSVLVKEDSIIPPVVIIILAGGLLAKLALPHQETTVESYFSLLVKLIEKHQLGKKDLLGILTLQNGGEGTLGTMIALHQNAETIISYLFWLDQLIEIDALEKENVLEILAERNQNGMALGPMIALRQNAEMTINYLSWLSQLIGTQTIEKKNLLEMLWGLGMMIARNQNAEATITYLSLLKKLVEAQSLDLLEIRTQRNSNGESLYYMIGRYQNTDMELQYDALISRAEELKSERNKIQKEQGLSLQEAKLWLRYKRAFQEQLSKIKDSTPLSCDDICRVAELSEDQANEFDQKTKLLQGMLKIDVLSAACLESESKFEFRNKIISFLEDGADRYHYRISEKASLYEYAAQSRRASSESIFFESETTRFFKKIAQKDRESEKQTSQQQPYTASIIESIPLTHKVYSIKKVLVWGLTSTQ